MRAGMTLIGRPEGRLVQGGAANQELFFARKMYALLSPELKDSTRIFGSLERELIYYRDKKRCQRCEAEVLWSDHEIHHVETHATGGRTVIENGVLVHKHCHPKGRASEAFAEKYWAKLSSGTQTSTNDA